MNWDRINITGGVIRWYVKGRRITGAMAAAALATILFNIAVAVGAIFWLVASILSALSGPTFWNIWGIVVSLAILYMTVRKES